MAEVVLELGGEINRARDGRLKRREGVKTKRKERGERGGGWSRFGTWKL
jgi:hypothetical protein